jgi:hypothetical protein
MRGAIGLHEFCDTLGAVWFRHRQFLLRAALGRAVVAMILPVAKHNKKEYFVIPP